MGINHTVVMQLFYWVYLHICISIGGGGQLQSDTDYWERVILLQQSANYDSRQNENKQKSVSHNIVPPWTGGRDVLKCSLAGWLAGCNLH